MYRILLVDDEPRQVRALANIISKLRPDCEVHTAGDGREALDFILRNRIDILMTDIRMPVMDGIELIEKLSERKLEIRIVILSGYGEFEYAQKAIRFGVNDYLVKPISKENLQELLSKFIQSIREEQEQLRSQEELKKKLDHSLPVYLERQLNKWVAGSLDRKGVEEIASIFPFKGAGAVFVMHLGRSRRSGVSSGTASGVGDLPQDLKSLIKEFLNPLGHTLSFVPEGYPCALATIVNANPPFHFSDQDNRKRMKELQSFISSEYDIAVTLGLSTTSRDIFHEISKCFREAVTAAERRFFTGQGVIIDFSELRSDTAVAFDFNTLEKELSDAVKRADRGSAIGLVGKAFENARENSREEPQRLREEWTHLVLNQIRILFPLLPEEEYGIFAKEAKEGLANCEDYKELWHCINRILDGTIGLFLRESGKNSGSVIEKCKRFLDENYMNELTLESVAQKYHFNPSYFSNLFKNLVGYGFSEYLNGIRMQKAQVLLKSTDDSMADVAARVGFRDPAYFNRAFKRRTGLSPLKYRKLHGNR